MANVPEYLVGKEYELIWVSKELAEQYNKSTTPDLKEKIIKQEAELVKRDMEGSIEQLEDDVLQYKYCCNKYKQEFKDVSTTVFKDMQDFYEKISEEHDTFLIKTKKEYESLKKEMKEISDFIKTVNQELKFYSFQSGINDLTSSIEKFKNMYGKEKEVFDFLLKNFKSKE